jgi:hypothetical protein
MYLILCILVAHRFVISGSRSIVWKARPTLSLYESNPVLCCLGIAHMVMVVSSLIGKMRILQAACVSNN